MLEADRAAIKAEVAFLDIAIIALERWGFTPAIAPGGEIDTWKIYHQAGGNEIIFKLRSARDQLNLLLAGKVSNV